MGERRRRAPPTPPPAIDPESNEPLYTVDARPPRHVARAADRGATRPPGADRGGSAGPDRAGAAAGRRARRRGRGCGARCAGGALGRRRRAGTGGGGSRSRRSAPPRVSRTRSSRCGRRRPPSGSELWPRRRPSSPACGPSWRSCGPRSAPRASSSGSAGAPTTPAAHKKEAERDRRLGAASDRATRASRSLARLDEPLPRDARHSQPATRWSRRSSGVRGTIAEIVGDEATVLGRGGLRIRGAARPASARSRRTPADRPDQPAVTVRAMIQNDLPGRDRPSRPHGRRRHARRSATSSTRRRSRAGPRCA